MWDLLIDLIEGIFEDGPSITDIDISGVISDALLIGGTIFVAKLTVDSIRDKLKNRQELKNVGAKYVIIKEFMEDSGCTEVSFAALDAQNKQVGSFSMKGRSVEGLKVGQKIAI